MTRNLQLWFTTDLADFGERMAENDKAWPLEERRGKDKEDMCETVILEQ